MILGLPSEKVRGRLWKSALPIFQKVNAIALEPGGLGKASGGIAPRPKGRANCSGVTRDPGESISHAQAAGDDDRSLLIVTYLNPNPSLRRASTRRSRPLRESASRMRLAEWWDQVPRTFMPWLA